MCNVIIQGTDAMQSTVCMHVQEAVTHSVSSPSLRWHPSAAGSQVRAAAPAGKLPQPPNIAAGRPVLHPCANSPWEGGGGREKGLLMD